MYYTSSYPCRDPSIKEIVTTKMVTMRCLVSGTRVDSTPARARSWPPELRVTVPVTVHYIIPPALISDSLSGRLRARSLHEVAIVAIVAGPHAKNATMRVRPSCDHVGHPSLNDPRALILGVWRLSPRPRPRGPAVRPFDVRRAQNSKTVDSDTFACVPHLHTTG